MLLCRVIFVALVVELAAASSSSGSYKQCVQKREADGTKVIIVGAGVSGLAAASRLLLNNISDVTVLEAMDRIGGRIHFQQLDNGKGGVDMGAHWVHGQKGNAVYELAQPLGLVNHSGDFENIQFFYADGSEADFGDQNLFDMFMGVKYDPTPINEEDAKKNYEQYTHEKADKKLNELNVEPESRSAIKRHMSRYMCILFGCDRLSDVSTKQSHDFQDAEGDMFMEWIHEGMNNIINLLIGKHEKSPWRGLNVESRVKFSTKVTQVDWSGDEVRVTTDSGDVLTAHHVVFTPSLNILKQTHREVFSPPLPQDKVSAIQKLGMDVVDKICLVFDQPWWPTGASAGFSFIHDKIYPTETQNWEDDITAFTTLHHNPNVLCGWITGAAAKQMENDTVENVKTKAMKTLRHYLRKTSFNIPEPVQVVRSTWWNNENVRGSVSLNHKDSDDLEQPRNILAQPVTNKNGKQVLLLAGEAVSLNHFTAVHGALESGWMQADRIISAPATKI